MDDLIKFELKAVASTPTAPPIDQTATVAVQERQTLLTLVSTLKVLVDEQVLARKQSIRGSKA